MPSSVTCEPATGETVVGMSVMSTAPASRAMPSATSTDEPPSGTVTLVGSIHTPDESMYQARLPGFMSTTDPTARSATSTRRVEGNWRCTVMWSAHGLRLIRSWSWSTSTLSSVVPSSTAASLMISSELMCCVDGASMPVITKTGRCERMSSVTRPTTAMPATTLAMMAGTRRRELPLTASAAREGEGV